MPDEIQPNQSAQMEEPASVAQPPAGLAGQSNDSLRERALRAAKNKAKNAGKVAVGKTAEKGGRAIKNLGKKAADFGGDVGKQAGRAIGSTVGGAIGGVAGTILPGVGNIAGTAAGKTAGGIAGSATGKLAGQAPGRAVQGAGAMAEKLGKRTAQKGLADLTGQNMDGAEGMFMDKLAGTIKIASGAVYANAWWILPITLGLYIYIIDFAVLLSFIFGRFFRKPKIIEWMWIIIVNLIVSLIIYILFIASPTQMMIETAKNAVKNLAEDKADIPSSDYGF